jgi:Flp pilus assembly protein TadG
MHSGRRIADFARDEAGSFVALTAFVVSLLVVVVGATTDYIQAINLRNRLQSAADASAVAGAVAARDSSSGGTSQADRNAAKARADAHFAEAAGRIGSSASGTAAVSYSDATITANLTWQATFVPAFSRIVGIETWPVSGTAQALAPVSLPTYIDIHFVLDTSHSMAIGATASDQSTMMNRIGCTIGCHMQTGQDTVARARSYGATLRFDVVKSAVATILTKAKSIQDKSIAAGRGSVIRVAIHTFSNTMKTPFARSTDIAAASTALTSIDIDPAIGQSGTNFHTLFTSLGTAGLAFGDGKTASTPKSFVILMTDGVEGSVTQRSGNPQWTRDAAFVNYAPYDRDTSFGFNWDIQGFDPSLCTSLKSRGAYMMTLNVEYLIPTLAPDSNDGRYLFVKNTLKSRIQTNMSSCASTSEMALYASSPADITAATDKLFTLAVSTSAYLAK